MAATIDRYPAPEFHENPEDTDQRADIYSFAVLSYRILTGKLPAGRYKDPLYYVPEMSPTLNNLILDSLAEQPNERPYNSVELLIKLKACFDEKFAPLNDLPEQEYPEKEIQLTLMKSAPNHNASEPNGKIPLIEKLQAKEEKLNIAKEELQNLKKQIICIFRENGSIPEREWNNLIPIGILNGLDKKALNQLISHLKTEHKEDIDPAIKFVKSIDQHLLESQLSLSQKTLKSLKEEALKISWDKKHLSDIITERSTVLGPKISALNALSHPLDHAKTSPLKAQRQSPKEPKKSDLFGLYSPWLS